MKAYPLCLTGLDRRVSVVVGGGTVAARKAASLLEAGAHVTVISPELGPEMAAMSAAGEIEVVLRPYRDGDLAGCLLVIAATNDPATNQAVWQEAERVGCLVNVVDDPAHSNFIVPAVVRRGEVTIAVSTGGASPALARHLRQQLEAAFGPEYAELAALLAELRPQLPPGAVRLDVVAQLLDIMRDQGIDAARAAVRGFTGGSDPHAAQGDA